MLKIKINFYEKGFIDPGKERHCLGELLALPRFAHALWRDDLFWKDNSN